MSKSKNHIEKMEELLADLKARELEEKQPILEELQKLYQEQPDETTALIYAKGLFNLTVDQNLEGREQTVERLANLSSRFPADSAIALRYAKGLYNLTVDQNLEGREQTVERLANLSSRFPADSSIALAYAKGLVNLTVAQNLEGREQTVERLANLSSRFPADSAIALRYANGLYNLTLAQNLEGREQTVERLANLSSRFPADSAIALRYAKDLVNLTVAQNLEGREQTVERLANLSSRFPADSAIALRYAKGLYNLTLAQDLSGREQTFEKLSNLFSRFPADSAIALRYAKCLLKLTVAQDLEGCEHTVKELANLSSRFPADSSIALAYAKGLVNLSIVKESSEELIGISDKLEELFKRFPKSSEIAEQTSRLQLIIGEKSEGDEATKVAFAQALSYMNNRLPENHHSLLESFLMFFSKYEEEKLCLLVETLLKPDFIDLLNGIEATTIIKATDCYFYTSENWANVQKFLFACKEQLSESKYAYWLDMLSKSKDKDSDLLFKATKACKTILHLLRVNKKDLTHLSHYTALETLPKILLGKKDEWGNMARKGGKVEMAGRYRFYNANYMNDPEEGKLLHKWLGAEEESIDQVSPFYLMSLTTESDDLPMWVQYGRDGKGICVTLHDDLFEVKNSRAEHELIPRATDLKQQEDGEETDGQDKPKISSSKEGERFTPYRICYMSDTSLYGNLFEPAELKKIKEELKKLKGIFTASSQKKEIYQIMEEIRFLFKSADYVTENEVRLLKYADLKSDKILLDETGDGVPRLYVEQDGHVKIKKITFGPKVYNESKIVPYIKFCDPEIEIGVSGIHFR